LIKKNSNSVKLRDVTFNFLKLKFKPLATVSKDHDSNSILKEIVSYLNNQRTNGLAHLIDRNARNDNNPRELFMTTHTYVPKDGIIRFTLARLRSGKLPKLKPKDKYKLMTITEMGSIAEETHFFVDFRNDIPTICIEYNFEGARASDIEYYFRSIARDELQLARSTEIEIIMDTSIKDALENFKNVLKFDVKINPKNISELDRSIKSYYSGHKQLTDLYKPRFLKVEFLYEVPGTSIKSKELNNYANSVFTNTLKVFKSKPLDVEFFDNFTVKYENKKGEDAFFSTIKGKKEEIYKIPLKKQLSVKESYELVRTDFLEFINN